MTEKLKQEVRELYESFNKTSSFYEKGYILSFFEFLIESIPDDIEIIKMYRDLYFKVQLEVDEHIKYALLREKRIEDFMDKKNLFFENHFIRLYKSHKLLNDNLKSLSKENISSLFESFFLSMDSDILSFYQKMNEENRIIYGKDNVTAYTSLREPKTIIFIEKLNNLKDMMILAHEIGHAYYFYLNKTRICERENFIMELKEEIPAKIFEIKFIDFLQHNGVYNDSLVLEKIFNKIMYDCNSNRKVYDNLKYLIGSIIARRVKEEDIDIEKYFRYIYRNDIYNIVNEKTRKKILGKVLKK